MGDLKGNRFTINVRDTDTDAAATKETVSQILSEIQETGGFPNYYGIQRFGIARPVTHLVGEQIVRGDLRKAVEIYLFHPSEFEDDEVRNAREILSRCDGDYSSIDFILPKLMGFEQTLVDYLRQNPGGLITSCVEVAREVVPKGNIVSVVDKNGAKEAYDSELEAPYMPVAVLMDNGSASASEILAGALQDTGAGKVVGVQSYGKGSVQIVVPLMNVDGLKLTVAKYYTPSGRSIDGTGITPDVEAALVPGSGVDSQLEKAKEVLKQELGEPL
jgi:hypothetical protein